LLADEEYIWGTVGDVLTSCFKKNEMGNSFGELLEMPGRFSSASCSLEMGFVTLVPILCLFVS